MSPKKIKPAPIVSHLVVACMRVKTSGMRSSPMTPTRKKKVAGRRGKPR
ncbi:MAG: hypothetical protein MZU97_21175 [Bacillus subtilis]|nr:hypothetical protein [Bacillus subtilis]